MLLQATLRHLELHNFTPQKTVSIVPLAKKVSKEHYPEGCFWLLIGALLNIIEGFQSVIYIRVQFRDDLDAMLTCIYDGHLITHKYPLPDPRSTQGAPPNVGTLGVWWAGVDLLSVEELMGRVLMKRVEVAWGGVLGSNSVMGKGKAMVMLGKGKGILIALMAAWLDSLLSLPLS
ncbi:hypothetical protein Tco_0753126 [Tanacetum coccineum]